MNAIAQVEQLTLDERVDWIQSELAKLPQLDCPQNHIFTPGLYVREIFMPAGAVFVSKIHRSKHPFVISKGAVSVWMAETGWQRLEAPHTGVTMPGARRILFIHEDCVWSTFHPTTETDLEKIESQLIEPRDVEPLALAVVEKLKLTGGVS